MGSILVPVLLASGPMVLAAPPAPAAAPRPAIAKATTVPAMAVPDAPPNPRDVKIDKLVKYLFDEYGRLLKSPDWVTRSLALISIARLPTEATTKVLLTFVARDPHPAVKMVAWEALLARASLLDDEAHAKWLYAGWKLAEEGHFRGRLRIGLVRAMATGLVTKQAKDAFTQLLAMAKGSYVGDDQVVKELGVTLRAWRSANAIDLVDELVKVASGKSADAERAAGVLRAAGAPAGDLAAWWNTEKLAWRDVKRDIRDEPWRKLTANVLPKVLSREQIDPDSKAWYKELELKKPQIKNFDVAFVVDISGSMTTAIEWLRREASATAAVLGIFAPEPRIGVTWFSGPKTDVQTVKLTGKIADVRTALKGMKTEGGGEEEFAKAMEQAYTTHPWPTSESARKVMIVLSDEEIVARLRPECARLARDFAAKNFRTYFVTPDKRIFPGFTATAEAGKGAALGLGLPRAPRAGAAPARGRASAPVALSDAGTVALISKIVGDAVTPEYRDRIIPLVTIVLAMNTEPAD
ncbi:MAG: vWA domain-containing protein [Phycisphaerae bacterium]